MPKARSRVAGAALAVALAALPVGVGAAPPGWTDPEPIGIAAAAEDLRVVVDADGNDHVAIHRQSPNNRSGIWYATNQSGSWTNRQITDDQDPFRVVFDRVADLDVSATGNAFLLIRRAERWNSDSTPDEWYDGPGAGWYLATNRSGPWILELLPMAPTNGSAKFEVRSGKYHVVFVRRPAGGGADQIIHKTNNSGSWVTREVPLPGAGYANSVDFKLDPNGSMAVAYIFEAPEPAAGVFLSEKQNGAWSRRKLHTTVAPRAYPSDPELAIDAGHGVHLIWQVHDFRIPEKHHLWYASTRTGWTKTRIVESRSYDGVVAADSNGKAHIVYQDNAGNQADRLGYATNAGGAWQHVELIRESPSYIGVGVDPQRRPHAFFDDVADTFDILVMRKQ